MRPSSWSAAIVVAACLAGIAFSVAAGAAGKEASPTVSAPKAGESAYTSLQSRRLVDTLGNMGMSELLRGLRRELGSEETASVPNWELAADTDVSDALRDGNLENRNRLLDEAIEIRKKIVDATAGSARPEEQLQYFSNKFKLADLIGRTRVEPYVLRLLYLRGSQEDRTTIIELTGQAAALIDQMTGRRGEFITKAAEWKRNSRILVTLGPEIEDLETRITYYSSWIRLYRGMALSEQDAEGAERIRLLRNSALSAEKLAKGSAETGVKYWAMLLCGRANRELHQYAMAETWLKNLIADANAEPAARMDGAFEQARNAIEKSKYEASKKDAKPEAIEAAFKAAEATVNGFAAAATQVLGAAHKVEIDLKNALLGNYLYETWATCVAKDPAKLAKCRSEAQKALLAFVAANPNKPDLQVEFFKIVGPKYRDRTDYKDLDPVVLVSMAIYEYSLKTKESKAKCKTIVNEVLSRPADGPDKATLAAIRPMALGVKGWLDAEGQDHVTAGNSFLAAGKAQAASKSPEAFNSVLNAVKSFGAEIGELVKTQQPIPTSVRSSFVEAGELLMSKPEWQKDPQAAGWILNIAYQCEELAKIDPNAGWLAKASMYYGMVPESQADYMQAQHLRLELAVQVLYSVSDAKDRAAGAPKLVSDLLAYADRAKSAAARAKTDAEKQRLMTWGGRAAFQAAGLEYYELNKPKEAMDKLDKLATEWPGTPVLSEVSSFQIRVLIQDKKTKDAIQRMHDFMVKYPQETGQLLQLVLGQIREQIVATKEQFRQNPANKQIETDLGNYRGVYLEFAQEMIKQVQDANSPPERVFGLKRVLGEAQNENGKFADGLKTFEDVLAFENQKIDDLRRKLDAEYTAKVAAVTDNTSADDLKKMADEVTKIKTDLNLPESSANDGMRAAITFLDDKKSSSPMDERIKVAAGELKKAMVDQCERRKKSVQADWETLLGLARSCRGLGQYEKAETNYRQALRMQPPASDAYWRMQLEYCECIRDGHREDPAAMKNLATLVADLRMKDETFHGLKSRFDPIEMEARSKSGSK